MRRPIALIVIVHTMSCTIVIVWIISTLRGSLCS